jgi:mannose-6-phosphate isomerase-like protein (cupin superfamily)
MGNAAARLVTAVNSDPRYAIEVYEIAVGREPAELHMDGAAILEVRYGDGMVDVDGRTTKVSPGSVVSVAEGAALRVTNTTPLPMTLRANVIRAKR